MEFILLCVLAQVVGRGIALSPRAVCQTQSAFCPITGPSEAHVSSKRKSKQKVRQALRRLDPQTETVSEKYESLQGSPHPFAGTIMAQPQMQHLRQLVAQLSAPPKWLPSFPTDQWLAPPDKHPEFFCGASSHRVQSASVGTPGPVLIGMRNYAVMAHAIARMSVCYDRPSLLCADPRWPYPPNHLTPLDLPDIRLLPFADCCHWDGASPPPLWAPSVAAPLKLVVHPTRCWIALGIWGSTDILRVVRTFVYVPTRAALRRHCVFALAWPLVPLPTPLQQILQTREPDVPSLASPNGLQQASIIPSTSKKPPRAFYFLRIPTPN